MVAYYILLECSTVALAVVQSLVHSPSMFLPTPQHIRHYIDRLDTCVLHESHVIVQGGTDRLGHGRRGLDRGLLAAHLGRRQVFVFVFVSGLCAVFVLYCS
jgi:hypothetical protein